MPTRGSSKFGVKGAARGNPEVFGVEASQLFVLAGLLHCVRNDAGLRSDERVAHNL